MKMRWTEKSPTKDGWYWLIQVGLLNAQPKVVNVDVIKWKDKSMPNITYISSGDMNRHVIKQYDPLLWYGPLKVPSWKKVLKGIERP